MMMIMSHIFLCCHHIFRRSATPVLLANTQNVNQSVRGHSACSVHTEDMLVQMETAFSGGAH